MHIPLGVLIMLFFIFITFLIPIINVSRLNIQFYYTSIVCWVILHDRKIMNVIIFLIYICYTLINAEVVYAMDTLTEMSLKLQEKIAKLEANITYYQEQAIAADQDFKEVLNTKAYCESKGLMDEWQREYKIVESALKDTNVNLNSEKRMVNILKAKLENGDYDLVSKSTATKRKFTD